jgi:sec-independent protein translocase protein TatC
LPLVVLFLGRMGLVSLASFRKYRRLAILIIFVVAAVASPGPDVVSQLCLAIPMILLYELGLILLRFSKRKEPAA